MVQFVINVEFRLSPYLDFGCHCVSSGMHLGFIYSPFGLQMEVQMDLGTKREPEICSGLKIVIDFPRAVGYRIVSLILMFFLLCTQISWLFGHVICRCDCVLVFGGSLDPWKAANHGKPWEALTQSRSHAFRKKKFNIHERKCTFSKCALMHHLEMLRSVLHTASKNFETKLFNSTQLKFRFSVLILIF